MGDRIGMPWRDWEVSEFIGVKVLLAEVEEEEAEGTEDWGLDLHWSIRYILFIGHTPQFNGTERFWGFRGKFLSFHFI